ncbi:hypothetical protein FB565_007419 [Actinoplanes lutulentus]|uniref:Uncharacterized protein n=1 Tax=Actinoplanes lutulentus TaxID=1287878 RepID=A0A327Z1Q5_9ACTN|nr:hypothetical protein [Actinoplanes lutulentus]MBB2947648.1 hypothetical protein [Actinoplanes lutulentus]RAK27704.1 hypothetical protein B0I29_12287 [Actinoplanes lutulentus]
MTNIVTRATAVALAGALVAASAVTPASAAPAVRGVLLPVPAAGPGEALAVTASDVSPLGVVAGTARVTTTGPDGNTSIVETPYRWAGLPRVGWQRQRLALPAGATSGSVSSITDLGEVAGDVTVDGATRATRWSITGTTATLIGEPRSRAGAVDPRGATWGVSTAGPELISGKAELVARSGTRTLLSGTPELDAGYRRYVISINATGTTLVSVFSGVGQGTTARPVLWRDGATVPVPVFGTAYLGPACVSRVQADGSVVASGFSVTGGLPKYVLLRHTGGVPGTNVILTEATQGQPVGGLVCPSGQTVNNLAADGGVAGVLSDASGGRSAAYWNAANQVTVVPLAAGELSAQGVAVANGRRMVILADGADGTNRLSLWHDGVRTELPAPRGWTIRSVVELTESGVLIANVQDAAGTIRPAAWSLS